MEGQKALEIHQKYLNLCSEDEQRSYGFGTTWEGVINDRIVCCSGSAERLSSGSAGDLHVSAETRQRAAAERARSDRQRHTPLQQGQQERRRGHPEPYVSLPEFTHPDLILSALTSPCVSCSASRSERDAAGRGCRYREWTGGMWALGLAVHGPAGEDLWVPRPSRPAQTGSVQHTAARGLPQTHTGGFHC